MFKPTMFAAVFAALQIATPATAERQAELVVPTVHKTIQSAVNAARPGDRIRVLPGTYVEQVSIRKNLEIVGAGAGRTIIRAPAVLVPGPLGTNAIVDILGGASVAMAHLTVSGPGAGTCENGALRDGILVLDNAHLDLRFASVQHIHDTPLFNCFHSGHGINIGGDPFASTGSATIRETEIHDYAQVGVIAFNEGTTVDVSKNVIAGAGLSPIVATGGVELLFGAAGVISHNLISGNACGAADLGCGPDFFNEFQVAGISGGGAGTVISHNFLYGNQVGIYVGEAAELSHNTLIGNHHFGLALQDGSFTASHERIFGGGGGVAIIAAFADTSAKLKDVQVHGTSGPSLQLFECCGFTATATALP